MNYWWWSNYMQSWEKYVLRYISKKEENNVVVFDVWSNVWWYANMCIEVFWLQLKGLHCFEPSKKTFKQLINNVKDKSNIVKYNNFWLWNNKAKWILFWANDDSGWISLFNRDLWYLNIKSNELETVNIKNIDTYVRENMIELITLLNLDIEWYELLALKWGIDIITSWKVKYIQFEFWGTGIDARIYFKDFWNLLSSRYDIYRILPNNLFQIKQYEESLEIFMCVNFLCILR